MQLRYPHHAQLYLGPGWALYCGAIQRLETHVYGADVMHVGIYRPFRIRFGHGEWRSVSCAVVPAGTHHALDMAGGIHGKLFVEKNSAIAAGWRHRFGGGAGGTGHDAEAVGFFREIHEHDPARSEVEQRLESLLGERGQTVSASDPRIVRVTELLAGEPDRNFSQEELARLVGLSPSRFLHLFRQQTGLPYRRFRGWNRMMAAFGRLHAGDSLTRAALEAGFADS
ncbi:MAG: helix-turn-helix transcriptional regulator, partial [Methylococcaceae bacterium]|nr:helix-turn-helix transcriptional regulator [Methylococcaceae bacterium]